MVRTPRRRSEVLTQLLRVEHRVEDLAPIVKTPGPVHVKDVVPNELIVFTWEVEGGGYDTRVEMKFESLDERSTLLTITESGWKENPKGLKSSYGNCHGWTQMSCSLKVYIEHGINLREGFY